jgi:hypothetical protein
MPITAPRLLRKKRRPIINPKLDPTATPIPVYFFVYSTSSFWFFPMVVNYSFKLIPASLGRDIFQAESFRGLTIPERVLSKFYLWTKEADF